MPQAVDFTSSLNSYEWFIRRFDGQNFVTVAQGNTPSLQDWRGSAEYPWGRDRGRHRPVSAERQVPGQFQSTRRLCARGQRATRVRNNSRRLLHRVQSANAMNAAGPSWEALLVTFRTSKGELTLALSRVVARELCQPSSSGGGLSGDVRTKPSVNPSSKPARRQRP